MMIPMILSLGLVWLLRTRRRQALPAIEGVRLMASAMGPKVGNPGLPEPDWTQF